MASANHRPDLRRRFIKRPTGVPHARPPVGNSIRGLSSLEEVPDHVLVQFPERLVLEARFAQAPGPADRAGTEHLGSRSRDEIDRFDPAYPPGVGARLTRGYNHEPIAR